MAQDHQTRQAGFSTLAKRRRMAVGVFAQQRQQQEHEVGVGEFSVPSLAIMEVTGCCACACEDADIWCLTRLTFDAGQALHGAPPDCGQPADTEMAPSSSRSSTSSKALPVPMARLE